LSSSDNPQFEPQHQPSVNTDPPVPIAPEVFVPGEAPAPPPPDENPVWSGWDVLLMAILTLLTLFLVESLTVLSAWLLVYRHTSFGELIQKPLLALIGEFLSYIVIAIYMVMLVEGKYHTPFGRAIRWNWPLTSGKLLAFGGLGVLTVSLDLLSRFLPMPKTTPFDQFFDRPLDAYLVAVFAVTFGPLMEELFFRGFLYPVLVREMGVAGAVVLTALPFGLIHYLQYRSWAAVLVIMLVGAVLTVVRAVTKSVAASFLVHAGYNGTLMVLAALATDGFRHMEKAAFSVY
jgi:CAAX protease family protein